MLSSRATQGCCCCCYLPLDEDLPGLEGEYDEHVLEDEGHGVALLVQVEGGLHPQVVAQVDAPLQQGGFEDFARILRPQVMTVCGQKQPLSPWCVGSIIN